MTDREIIKKINNTNWYRQGGAIVPYYPSMAYRALFDNFGGFNFYQDEINYGYLDRDKGKIICNKLITRHLKDKNYFQNHLISPWRIRRNKLYQFMNTISVSYLACLSDRELIKLHGKFISLRLYLWRIGALIESFDPWDEEIINEYLKRSKLNLAPKDVALFTGPWYLGFNQHESLERLRLTLAYKEGRNISSRVINHTKKYHWLLNSWAKIVYLHEKYFWEQIKKEAKTKATILRRMLSELEMYQTKIEVKIRQLTKKYRLPGELKNILSFFRQMTDWRDERKEQIHRVNSIADLFLTEFSLRTGIEKQYLLYLEACETTSIARIKKLKKHLQARKKGSLYYTFGKTGICWFVGRKALKLHALLEKNLLRDGVLKGSVANRGKAVGRVKIVITSRDFSKIQRGDILITQMTRPEYLPILHKAAAIVTDEGGITCHAAIISRELAIPCIIGTQIATSILRDGDMVEVDANKGVVKKLT